MDTWRETLLGSRMDRHPASRAANEPPMDRAAARRACRRAVYRTEPARNAPGSRRVGGLTMDPVAARRACRRAGYRTEPARNPPGTPRVGGPPLDPCPAPP